MNRRAAFPTAFPLAPRSYDPEFLNKLVRVLYSDAIDSTTPGDLVGASLLLINPPGTGYGLRTGTAWVDATGYLRLVQEGDVFAASTFLKMTPGKVTVTTT